MQGRCSHANEHACTHTIVDFTLSPTLAVIHLSL
jgi:hypothetical protein